MLKWVVIVLICGFFTLYGWADVVITELSGTNNAEYGSTHSLQCSYNYENETGVEIKWFYNGNDQIFVWIPNRTTPNAIDTWKAVLDTNYTAPDHDMTHSVIHFKELDFDLTGYYTCKVTGDDHEDTRTGKMIVYQPASFLEFDLVSDENNTVTLSCSVYDLFPKPTIEVTGLYLSEKNGTVPLHLTNEKVNGDQDTLVNVTKTFIFNKDELIAPNVEFTCNVTIGETKYSIAKSLEYTKSGYETYETTSTEYYYNETTTEYEISAKKSSVDNAQKPQGDFAPTCSMPSKLFFIFVFALSYTRNSMV